MAKKILEKLIKGEWINPADGKLVTLPECEIAIERGLIFQAPDLLKKYKREKIILVCDENTYIAAAEEIENSLKKAGFCLEVIQLPSRSEPKMELAEKISALAKDAGLIAGVGSGTINDLCKYAAYRACKPYLIFATALSMNGYTSANASIKDGKYKKTLKAKLAAAVYIDLSVIKKSPVAMTRAGFGDMAARPSAQADWLLAHLVLGTEFNPLPFRLLEENEKELEQNIAGLAQGGEQALRILAEGLLLSGFGMYLAGSSIPASGGEHMIAHYMEMVYPGSPPNLHGAEIGVTAIYMLELQEKLLSEKIKIGEYRFSRETLNEKFGREIGAQAFLEMDEKNKLFNKADAVQKINHNWGMIAEKIKPVIKSPAALRENLKMMGGAIDFKDLGWQEDRYEDAKKNGFLLRNRFGFLDIAGLILPS